MNRLTPLLVLPLLFACSADTFDVPGIDGASNENAPVGDFSIPPGMVIERIQTDASAVQAAAPPSTGKSDPGLPEGMLGYMEGTQPDKLVVFAHGLGHDVFKSWTQYVARTVRDDVAVVTTNYRDNDRFPILRGAHDTIAGTLLALERFPSVQTVYLLGISMGGGVSGTALTEAIHVTDDGSGLYDYWVALEPFTNMFEGYVEAAAALPEIATYMEEETGGTPVTQPAAYQRMSPALRAADMAAAGLRAAVVVHGFNDGLVAYNMGREMWLGLVTAGIPSQFFNVLRVAEGQDAGTDGTGLLTNILGLPDPNDELGFAGHADEADAPHPIMRVGFEQLELMLNGNYDEATPALEHFVDDRGLSP